MKTVEATREGLVGKATACGWKITKDVSFVALPAHTALYRIVHLVNPLNSKETYASVLDVGPHYTSDYGYVFGDARPLAEKTRPNKSGLDLGERVWAALDMNDNGPISWEFVDV